jgi:hypothetical protein
VRFDAEQSVSRVSLMWVEGMIAKDFEVQTWDGKRWQTAKAIKGNVGTRADIALDAPVKTLAVRVWITAPEKATAHLAEVCIK